MSRARKWLLPILIGVAAGACIGLAIFGGIELGNSAASGCHAAHALSNAVTAILERGEKDLPLNSYYKQHPGQLAQALSQYQLAISQLQAAVTC